MKKIETMLMKTTFYSLLICVLISCQTSETAQKEVKNYTIEQFYQNKKIEGGVWSEDETRLLVNSNETGIFNLYEINVQDGSQKQLTSSSQESIYPISYIKGSNRILYSSDKGGNEIKHIFLLDEDGKVENLTPEEKENTSFYGWNLDKKSFYYLSNKRDPKFFDLYKMAVDQWEPIMIYENMQGYGISGISWDESKIVLDKSITTSENKFFLLDIALGKMVEISDSINPASYGNAGFSKDGKNFFYTTNAGKEFHYLVQYELSSGERKIIYETKWDVMYSYLSKTEKYRVIGINEDGKTKLILKDNKTWEDIKFPEIPDGDVSRISFSESEKNIRLSVGTSKAPKNIYVYNFDSKELKKLTETLNKEINSDDLVSAEVVRFASFDGLEIPAIYYKPHNANSNYKVPAVLWIHGGPGGQSRVGYFPLIQYLVNHGYAVLAVNNRGSSGYGKTFNQMDDQNHGDKDLKDCIWGKKWLQSLDHIDTAKIGIMGGSYGGYMTMAAMAFTPDEFKVGVNIFGVTNWIRTLKSIPPYWESFRKALYAELGDPTTADSIRLYNISPVFHADKIKNPVMVLQGANDPRVLQIESDEIVAEIKKNNIPVEYIIFPDEGHGFVKKENEIKGYGEILVFLDKYLRETPAP